MPFIFHVTKLKQIFGIICGSKNTSLTTVSYNIYITVALSAVSSVNQYYALQSVQCTVKIECVKTIHLPWSQRFFLIFHRMRELRENREAANTSRFSFSPLRGSLAAPTNTMKNNKNLWDQGYHPLRDRPIFAHIILPGMTPGHQFNINYYYIALSHKDWELPNSRI